MAGYDYNNPLRDATVSPERVDMGVDYSGSGPIYALGTGRIVEADNAWSGAVGAPTPGTFIVERLNRGPLAGKFIYAAEDIAPSVTAGQKVDSNTVIGNFTGGGQIETGYASGRPGETMAAAKGQASTSGDPGASPTAFGVSYNNLLASLGASPGNVNGPVTGKLPKTWPDPGSPNQNANLTSSIFQLPTSIGTFFGDFTSADFLERAGLIIFGALLILIGIVILALPTATKVTGEVGSASRSITAASNALGGNSGGPTEEEKADRSRRLDLAERNVAVGEAKVQNVRMREERLSLGKPPSRKTPKHNAGDEPNPNPAHSES